MSCLGLVEGSKAKYSTFKWLNKSTNQFPKKPFEPINKTVLPLNKSTSILDVIL